MCRLAVLALLLGALGVCGEPRGCEHTGLCSAAANLAPFNGDIWTNEELARALATRSYKKEIVIMLGSAGRMLLPLLQSIQALEDLGYAHVMPLAREGACPEIAKHLPQVGCAWSSIELGVTREQAGPLLRAKLALFATMWRTTARAARAGYNVLLLDTDFILFQDPYRFLKSPALSSYTLMVQTALPADQAPPPAGAQLSDGGDNEYMSARTANPSLVYVQSASPAGPVVWTLAEVTTRLALLVDANWTRFNEAGLPAWCSVEEEDLFNGAMLSALAGRPTFFSRLECLEGIAALTLPASAGGAESGVSVPPQQLMAAQGKVVDRSADLENSMVQLPPELAGAAGKADVVLRWAPLKIPGPAASPAASASDAERLLAWLLPDPAAAPGEALTAFMEQLKAAQPDAPLWPGAGSGAAAVEGAPGAGEEKLLLMPPWLAADYQARGRYGYWDSAAMGGGPPRQVFGHVHHPPNMSAVVSKAYIRMATGTYDWAVARKLKGRGPYFCSEGLQGPPLNPDPPEGEYNWEPIPQLVALHPHLLLAAAKPGGISRQEWDGAVQGLVQVAAVLNRGVLLPHAPCSAAWALGTAPDRAPWPGRTEWIPHGAGTDACSFTPPMQPACLATGRAMLPLEYHQLADYFRLWRPMDPSPEKTMLLDGQYPRDPRQRLKWQPIREIPAEELILRSARMAVLPGNRMAFHQEIFPAGRLRLTVLFLGQPLKVTFQPSTSGLVRPAPGGNPSRPQEVAIQEIRHHYMTVLNLDDKGQDEILDGQTTMQRLAQVEDVVQKKVDAFLKQCLGMG